MLVLELRNVAGDLQNEDLAVRIDLGLQRGNLVQAVDFAQRNLHRHVGPGRFQHRHARGSIRNELEHDPLDRGLLAPVLVEGLQHHARSAFVAHDLVRAGADGRRLESVLAHLFDIGLGQDVGSQEAQIVGRGRRRGREHHDGLGRAGDLYVLQRAEKAVDGQALFLLRAVEEAELEVFGRQRGAVVEGHAVAQLDGQPHVFVVQPAPALDQRGLQRQVAVDEQRGIEHGLVQRLPCRKRDGGRIPGRHIHRIGDLQLIRFVCLGLRRRRRQPATHQQKTGCQHPAQPPYPPCINHERPPIAESLRKHPVEPNANSILFVI
ncbi:hypothetical protein FQZ97_615220 [compost metagenome]